jgi:glycogen operon protein
MSLIARLVCLASLAPVAFGSQLGAKFDTSGQNLTFAVYSAAASRVEVWIYDQPLGAQERLRLPMTADANSKVWSVTAPVSELQSNGVTGTVYYGYRAWGPNWIFDPTWTKGSNAGFQQDVDAQGNRFNPNKLLLDPYALEVSHDPLEPTSPGQQTDIAIYQSGSANRNTDTGTVAPKGIVVVPATFVAAAKPTRPFKDDIVYEVNLRGFTEADPSIPAAQRGTYAGAAQKAQYLKNLGVTAIEFLPVQEFQNDTNDVAASTAGDNYWGYDPYNYFAPDRRYASDKSPGGPTKEFQGMTQAMHAQGIKVYIDVVYNHTGEEGANPATQVGTVLTYRGLDNATYYEIGADGASYVSNNGVGPNLNTANPVVRNLIIDSLSYWSNTMGVDGFRFDLAPVLGNACASVCFRYDAGDAQSALNRAITELPLRPAAGGLGVDLIAEPWALGDGTYQLGFFPMGWAQWNDQFRDTLRSAQNLLGVDNVVPGALSTRFAGSSDRFQKPWYSVNFLVAHDGFTLRDLYSYDAKNNNQPWDKGPSDGGNDSNRSWDQGGSMDLQRQAARTGMALLMLSAGVPMMTGGDEMYRTQFGNNNMYNVDSPSNWLNYDNATQQLHFFNFVRKLLAFRQAHPSLRPAEFFRGADGNGNGLKDLTWIDNRGQDIVASEPGYFGDSTQHFLGYRLDGSEFGDNVQSLCVLYNGWQDPVTATLPSNVSGKKWYRVADTAPWMEGMDNFNAPGSEEILAGPTYSLAGRSALLLIEK